MRYMLLIYGDESMDDPDATPEQIAEMFEPWYAYDAKYAGIIRGGEPLMPTGAARSVRVRDGEPVVTDGPFAETREQLGGFYIFECDSMEEALEAAAECPGARNGTVEVRPIMDVPEPPS